MKYIIIENHESHSIAMDESGLFYRIANLGYEPGETVTDPIFMKSPAHKKKSNWKKISTIAAIFVCLLMTAVPFINSNSEEQVVVYMSINPEIHLELNEDGVISKIVPDNEDGKVLLEGYKYKGKSIAVVLSELIDRAEYLKYLSEGGDIHITVEADDEIKAKNVEVDLSQVLKETYVEKYLIKIKTNEEKFQKLDDVLKTTESALSDEIEQMTSEGEMGSSNYQTDSYNETTASTTESYTDGTTVTTTENSKPAVQATENSKPTVKPTEKPSDVVKPAEPSIQGNAESTSGTGEQAGKY